MKIYASQEWVEDKIKDRIPTPIEAEVGQIIVVKAVDENNKPTEWEAADLPDSIARHPDWNQNDEAASDFIENRPFYKEENIEELIFEGEINFDEDNCYYFDPQIKLKTGTKYAIIFNGLAYEEECYYDDTDSQIMIQVDTDYGVQLVITSRTLQIYGRKIDAPCYFKIFVGSLHVAKKIEPMFIQEDDRKMSTLNPYGSGSFSMNIRHNAEIGSNSHAEGSACEASGHASHAEGSFTIASGNESHAEGESTKALGEHSHAEGFNNLAASRSQNVIGEYNISEDAYLSFETEITNPAHICVYSKRDNIYFCDGYTFDKNTGLYELVPIEYESVMNGYAALSLRKNVYMIYGGKTGAVMYYGDAYSTGTGLTGTIRVSSGGIEHGVVNNTITRGKYAHIVGNGTSDEERSNAHTLDWNGVGWFQGGLQVGGTAQDGDGVGYVPVIPAGAFVGQTIVVKVVDENGKPTEWEAVDPWVITSSTEGSTKKFKLAVDDSGTITATEVT